MKRLTIAFDNALALIGLVRLKHHDALYQRYDIAKRTLAVTIEAHDKLALKLMVPTSRWRH